MKAREIALWLCIVILFVGMAYQAKAACYIELDPSPKVVYIEIHSGRTLLELENDAEIFTMWVGHKGMQAPLAYYKIRYYYRAGDGLTFDFYETPTKICEDE